MYYGLEALKPHLREWFAAGGCVDTSEGPGNFQLLSERPEYPTHWNLDWIERTLGHTTDQHAAATVHSHFLESGC
eukprot:4841321-Prymnesium_polylepis.1